MIVVWEKFNQAEGAVAKEATAGATIIRLSQGIDSEHGAAIRKVTLDYLTMAVARRLAGHGTRRRVGAGATEALGKVYSRAAQIPQLRRQRGPS